MEVKEKLRERFEDILESQNDEILLQELDGQLSVWQEASQSDFSEKRDPRFTEEQLKEIRAGYQRSLNPENTVSHQEVMEGAWKIIEKYAGKERRA